MAQTEDDLPLVLDAAQVARLLNLNLDYVRKLTREGKIPASRIEGGRTYRYLRDDIFEWLRAQRVTPAERTDAEVER
jgi:excisionase family DNA binding protein